MQSSFFLASNYFNNYEVIFSTLFVIKIALVLTVYCITHLIKLLPKKLNVASMLPHSVASYLFFVVIMGNVLRLYAVLLYCSFK